MEIYIGRMKMMEKRRRRIMVGDSDRWRRKAKAKAKAKAGEELEQLASGPPSRTRARLKQQQQSPPPIPIPKQVRKKLNQHEHQLTSSSDKRPSKKAKKSPKSDVHPTSNTSSVALPVQPLPHKHILELILDTLQRRDTYEIFAEPVDPRQVEDYYEIIKEPMDFGTMRAKLHEGMYATLEQFQHDVYLISGNAMHFNSSATIFFRQGRAIHQLSKKLFHALKSTDAEKFVLEFSGGRRRRCSRAQQVVEDQAKKSKCKSIPTSHERGVGSIFKTSFLGNLGFSSCAAHANARALQVGFSFGKNIISGAGAGDDNCEGEADRRYTYKARSRRRSMSFEDDFGVGGEAKVALVPLAVMEEEDKSYTESLMWFVRDLGPTAQMVGKRKLQLENELLLLGSTHPTSTTHSASSTVHRHHVIGSTSTTNNMFTFDIPFLRSQLTQMSIPNNQPHTHLALSLSLTHTHTH